MSTFPTYFKRKLTFTTAECDGIFEWAQASTFSGGGTIGTANTAIYVPILVRYTVTATKLFWFNNSTVNGNIDVGIYSADGTRIISTGSTVMSGGTSVQSVDITDTVLGPGLFYLAFVTSSTTATFNTLNMSSGGANLAGVYNQATALPLPASATFASQTLNVIPLMGFTVAPNTNI